MRIGWLAAVCLLGVIGFIATDAPSAHVVLLPHKPASPDRMLRTLAPPKWEWTRPDFDDRTWVPLADETAARKAQADPGAVLVPSLWAEETPPRSAAPNAPIPASQASNAAMLSDLTHARSVDAPEPEVLHQEPVLDTGLPDSPPVATIEMPGALVRGALSATFPGVPFLVSPAQSKRSGRAALPDSSPLLPACAGDLYVRRKFDFVGSDVSGRQGTLLLRARYADGFVAYVNGVEVLRQRLSEPAPGDVPLFANDRGPSDPERFYVSLGSSALSARNNVLALSVHPKSPLRCPQIEAELLWLHGPRLLRGPYIERLSDSTLDLTVETELPSKVVLRYGKGEKPLSRDRELASTDPAKTTHRLRLSGLRPATLHHYQVALLGEGNERTDLPVRSFHTLPDGPMPLRVVVYGDSRSGHPVHAQLVQAILAEDPDLVLHTGDLVERGTEESGWDRFFSITAPLLARIPVYVSPGNHDYALRKQGALRLFSLFETQFVPQLPKDDAPRLPSSRVLAHRVDPKPPLSDLSHAPRGYYSFDAAGVHFVSLDSNQAGKAEQHKWLEQDLTQAALQKNKPRAVVVWMHEGPFSIGWHGDFPSAIKHLVPILVRHRTTVLFSGHDHDYERGERQGLRYVVTGGGGAELRPLRCDPRRRHCKNQPQFFANEHHYVRVEILPTLMRICPRRLDGTPLEECQQIPL